METKVGSSRKKEIAEGVKNNHGFEHWFSPRKSHKQTKSNTKTRSEDFRDDPCICWRVEYSPLGVPWTARRSDQSILKEINERTEAQIQAPILWPPDAKSWLIGKDPDAKKDWKQKEKGVAEDEMVRWHHWFNGHEFEQTPGDNEGQGSLVCCSSWGCKKLDMT